MQHVDTKFQYAGVQLNERTSEHLTLNVDKYNYVKY